MVLGNMRESGPRFRVLLADETAACTKGDPRDQDSSISRRTAPLLQRPREPSRRIAQFPVTRGWIKDSSVSLCSPATV
jgi:hypothetical protein